MFMVNSKKIRPFFNKLNRKKLKYPGEYKTLTWVTSVFAGTFSVFVLLYFFPCFLYYEWGFIPCKEETAKDILQICFTISGVVFGASFQQFIVFYLSPDKDVMQPLVANSIFREICHSLDEFSEKINNDKKGLLNDKTEITILLSIPIVIDFFEIEYILEDKNYVTEFEKKINKIFINSDRTFKRSIYCLHTTPLLNLGISPFQRFLKSFCGYLITENFKEKKIDININKNFDSFCEKVYILRKHLTYRINKFCEQEHIKKNLKYVKEDDLQWQVLV